MDNFKKTFSEIYGPFFLANGYRELDGLKHPFEYRVFASIDLSARLFKTVTLERKRGLSGYRDFDVFFGIDAMIMPDIFYNEFSWERMFPVGGFSLGMCSRQLHRKKIIPPAYNDIYMPWISIKDDDENTRAQILDSFQAFTDIATEFLSSDSITEYAKQKKHLIDLIMIGRENDILSVFNLSLAMDSIYMNEYDKAIPYLDLNVQRIDSFIQQRKEMVVYFQTQEKQKSTPSTTTLELWKCINYAMLHFSTLRRFKTAWDPHYRTY